MREILCITAVVVTGYIAAIGIDTVGCPANLSLVQHAIYLIQVNLGIAK